ncbi:unnamed protein product [Hymenolepis diminuta]|uniref:Uncharacterized protein n=1 Tax=Hymenolepis diminuta TaxID=6216 RepID=A0A564Z0G9_HYMDI|nr:unnamed protein product [Hymenolepis diminuta]
MEKFTSDTGDLITRMYLETTTLTVTARNGDTFAFSFRLAAVRTPRSTSYKSLTSISPSNNATCLLASQTM